MNNLSIGSGIFYTILLIAAVPILFGVMLAAYLAYSDWYGRLTSIQRKFFGLFAFVVACLVSVFLAITL